MEFTDDCATVWLTHWHHHSITCIAFQVHTKTDMKAHLCVFSLYLTYSCWHSNMGYVRRGFSGKLLGISLAVYYLLYLSESCYHWECTQHEHNLHSVTLRRVVRLKLFIIHTIEIKWPGQEVGSVFRWAGNIGSYNIYALHVVCTMAHCSRDSLSEASCVKEYLLVPSLHPTDAIWVQKGFLGKLQGIIH